MAFSSSSLSGSPQKTMDPALEAVRRPRFVEHHRVHPRQPLQHGGILQINLPPRQNALRGAQRERRGQCQCARACHNQHRHERGQRAAGVPEPPEQTRPTATARTILVKRWLWRLVSVSNEGFLSLVNVSWFQSDVR